MRGGGDLELALQGFGRYGLSEGEYPKESSQLLKLKAGLFRQKFRNDKLGFTLAEVLITLGIIGVVAALTLPSLIANYKEKVLVTQAKKSYSVIMNAINRYNTDNESLGDNSVLMDASKTNLEILEELSKYFNGSTVCGNRNSSKCDLSYKVKLAEARNDGSGSNASFVLFSDAMILNDGSIVSLRRETTTSGGCYYQYTQCDKDADGNYIMKPDGNCQSTNYTSSRCGRIQVDTNGKKGPNRVGSDVFTFQIYRNNISFSDGEGNLNYILKFNKIQPYKDYVIGGDYGK